MLKSAFGQQGCRALTSSLARLSCFRCCQRSWGSKLLCLNYVL